MSSNSMIINYDLWHLCWLMHGSSIKAITKEAEEELKELKKKHTDKMLEYYYIKYQNGQLKPK